MIRNKLFVAIWLAATFVAFTGCGDNTNSSDTPVQSVAQQHQFAVGDLVSVQPSGTSSLIPVTHTAEDFGLLLRNAAKENGSATDDMENSGKLIIITPGTNAKVLGYDSAEGHDLVHLDLLSGDHKGEDIYNFEYALKAPQ